jgi:hypothetical protein
MIERAMFYALEQAAPETRSELLRLAQTEPLEAITQAVHERFPGYATLLTRERVAHVMATILQPLDTRPDAFGSHSLKSSYSLATPTTGYIAAITRQEKEKPGQSQASGYGQSGEQSLSRSRTLAHHRGVAHSPESDNGSNLVVHTVHSFPIAQAAQESPSSSPAPGHRQRIKAVMEQAQREECRLSYQAVAQAAGVGYSTVKKYAAGIRQELHAASKQE